MGLGLSMTQSARLEEGLRQWVGETGGDIPMYSLHRIRNAFGRYPLPLSPELLRMLERRLVAANADYRDESGNDWNCLTSNNLIDALDGLDGDIKEVTEGAITVARELSQAVEQIRSALEARRETALRIVKDWFDKHGDNLLYDMRGNIPWFVVRKLRAGLPLWVVGTANPFGQDIEDFVLEVARESGINTDTPEDAWEKMGGKVFKK